MDNKKVHTFITNKFLRKSKRFFVLLALFFVIIILAIIGWVFTPREYAVSGTIMGTTYHIKYITKLQSKLKQQATAEAVYATLSRIDHKMSTYKPLSELMRLNNWPVNEPFHISSELARVLETSFAISKLSDDFYDVTVGPLVNLWGFGPKSSEQKSPDFIALQNGEKKPFIPTKKEIEQAKKEIGYQFINLDIKTLTAVKKKKLFIDLSSIAKGYSVDQAAATLDHSGIHRYMIEVGGEICVKGKRIDEKPWRVAINTPENGSETPYKVLALRDKSMATSGDYLNYYDVNHIRYSHEINPKTGFPEKNNIASVTVISSSTMLADAYSTMFMVLPRKTGRDIAEKEGLAVYIIYREQKDNDQKYFSVYMSPTFKKYSHKLDDFSKKPQF